MTLAELFHAVNQAGVRLANVAGHLELRGAVIPPEVRAGTAEYKEVLLSLLPPTPGPAAPATLPEADADAAELLEEHAAIREEGEGGVSPEALAQALREWDEL